MDEGACQCDRPAGVCAAALEIVSASDPESTADRVTSPVPACTSAARSACCGEWERCASRLSSPVMASTSERSKTMASERSRAGVADETRRQHQTDAAAAPNELKRALDEQLIEVGVRGTLDAVDAGFADEVGETTRVRLPAGTRRLVAAVAADHVPWRISDHGVEPRSGPGLAVLVEEDFRKRQRPVMKPEARRRLVAIRCSNARTGALRQRASAHRSAVAISSRNVPRSGARPFVQNHPAHHRSRRRDHVASDDPLPCSEASVRSFSRTMAAESSGSVVSRSRIRTACSKTVARWSSGKSGSSSWRRLRAAPPPGWRRRSSGAAPTRLLPATRW